MKKFLLFLATAALLSACVGSSPMSEMTDLPTDAPQSLLPTTSPLPTDTPIETCLPINYGDPEELFSADFAGSVYTLDAADFNGDGLQDILVTLGNFQSDEVFEPIIYLNDGEGGLELATEMLFDGPIPLIQQASHIVFADFNADGATDFFVPDFGQDIRPWPGYQNTLVLSSPGGRLVDATSNLPQQVGLTHSAAAADIDGDGDVDIYVGNMQGEPMTPPQIWLNDGEGRFVVSEGRLPAQAADNTEFVYTAGSFVDVNSDDAPDLILGGHSNTPESLVLINDGAGFFTVLPDAMPAKPIHPENITLRIVPSHIDGDAFQDLMVVYTLDFYAGRYIQVLINNGDGTFRDETESRLPQEDNRAKWIKDLILIDIDNDGDLDITTLVPWSPWDIQPYYLNDGSGNYCEPGTTQRLTGLAGEFYTFIDFYGDGGYDTISTNGANMVYLIRDLGCDEPVDVGAVCRSAADMDAAAPEISFGMLENGYVIYDDSLGRGWGIYPHNASENSSSTNEVLAGTMAIELSWGDGGVVSLSVANPLDVEEFDWLVFHINGGPSADQQLMLGMLFEGQSVGPYYDLSGYLPEGRLVSGEWHQVVIPMEDLNIANSRIDTITILSQNMLQANPFYLDEIRLVGENVVQAPTTTPIPMAAISAEAFEAGHVVYDDALGSGWSFDPWGGSGDLSSTAVVYAGTHAIEATLQPDLSVTFDSAQFDVSPYDYLVFFVHGGDAADQDLYVEMMAGGEGVLGERAFLVDYMDGNALDAGAWMVAVVPLAVINPGGALMDWFDIGDASGNGASGFHIDEIRFVASGQ